MITDDGAGVANALAELISEQGFRSLILNPDALLSQDAIERALRGAGEETVAAFLHLAPLTGTPLAVEASPSDWHSAIERNEKVPYFVLQRLAGNLNNTTERNA